MTPEAEREIRDLEEKAGIRVSEVSEALTGLMALADPVEVGAGEELRRGLFSLFSLLQRELSEVSDLHREIGERRAEAYRAEATGRANGEPSHLRPID